VRRRLAVVTRHSPRGWTAAGLCATLLSVLGAGASRQNLSRELNAAYSCGLLSERTFCQRLDLLFGSCLVDPARVVGDLSIRLPRRRWPGRVADLLDATIGLLTRSDDVGVAPRLLALDWSGGQEEMLLGRHLTCDVVLDDLSVSRLHARLVFRDGHWVIQDLGSTNGTEVNGVRVGRCELHPGDHVGLGDERLRID